MNYFSGEYDCKVDAKGRMVLPSKIKAKLPESHNKEVGVTMGLDPCLVVYAMPEWNKKVARVSSLNENDGDSVRLFQRNFFRRSQELDLDNNGRLLLPKSMVRYAGIEKEVIIVGVGNKIEIWNPERYDEYLLNGPEEYSQLAKKFLGDE